MVAAKSDWDNSVEYALQIHEVVVWTPAKDKRGRFTLSVYRKKGEPGLHAYGKTREEAIENMYRDHGIRIVYGERKSHDFDFWSSKKIS